MYRSYLPVAASQPAASGWDHELPFTFGYFDRGQDPAAYLFFVLGAYHEPTRQERLFTDLSLDVIYGDSSDVIPPQIVRSESFIAYGQLRLTVRATDESDISQVVGV